MGLRPTHKDESHGRGSAGGTPTGRGRLPALQRLSTERSPGPDSPGRSETSRHFAGRPLGGKSNCRDSSPRQVGTQNDRRWRGALPLRSIAAFHLAAIIVDHSQATGPVHVDGRPVPRVQRSLPGVNPEEKPPRSLSADGSNDPSADGYLRACTYPLTWQCAGLVRRVASTTHHAMRAAVLQPNVRTVGEASRISAVRPSFVQVDYFRVARHPYVIGLGADPQLSSMPCPGFKFFAQSRWPDES